MNKIIQLTLAKCGYWATTRTTKGGRVANIVFKDAVLPSSLEGNLKDFARACSNLRRPGYHSSLERVATVAPVACSKIHEAVLRKGLPISEAYKFSRYVDHALIHENEALHHIENFTFSASYDNPLCGTAKKNLPSQYMLCIATFFANERKMKPDRHCGKSVLVSSRSLTIVDKIKVNVFGQDFVLYKTAYDYLLLVNRNKFIAIGISDILNNCDEREALALLNAIVAIDKRVDEGLDDGVSKEFACCDVKEKDVCLCHAFHAINGDRYEDYDLDDPDESGMTMRDYLQAMDEMHDEEIGSCESASRMLARRLLKSYS